MNYVYLLAVIGNRVVALVSVVILSFLLPPAAFGLYTLAATNALLIEVVLGSWIATSATKHIAVAGPEPDRKTVSTLAAAIVGFALLMGLLALAYTAYPFAQAKPGQIAIVLGWSTALMIYDATLASKNALGHAGSYAALALTRNLAASLLSILLVLAGYGAVGAMIGQIVGTVGPTVLLRSSLRIWKKARLREASKPLMVAMLRFGTAGTLALGLYMVFNGTSRNIIGFFLGEAAAGYTALATDLFYGPMALLGTAYSLSKLRILYLGEAETGLERQREQISEFLLMNLYFSLPYAAAGTLLAPDLAAAILSSANEEGVSQIAGAAVVQSSAMLMLYSFTTMMLIFNRRALLIPTVLGTSAVNGIVLYFAVTQGHGLGTLSWLSALVLSATVVLLIAASAAQRYVHLPMKTLARIGFATGVMAAAVYLYNRVLVPGEPFGAIALGCLIYVALTTWMKLGYARELAPAWRPAQSPIAPITSPSE